MPLNRPPRHLSRELVHEKCHDFVDFQVWPLRIKMHPEGWLANFQSSDLEYAYHLLNFFTYFSPTITDQLFVTAFHNISQDIYKRSPSSLTARGDWNSFLEHVHITYVTGENPSPTDSGYLFSRKARDLLSIPESRIMDPAQALARAAAGDRAPIVFVDDFVGSGNQFRDTWFRNYDVAGVPTSFGLMAASGALPPAYYCPPIATRYGFDRVSTLCPGVIVSAGNILDERYSVFHDHSLAWPEELRVKGPEFVKRVSLGLGLPDRGVWNYRGFSNLGLALAFAHKTPDATIPLFRLAQGGWLPLVVDG